MKQYNGEKAIISLTSWKKRIKTVSKTIFSLLTKCPGFHIVLVLSEEEFPQKEKELPEDLILLLNSNLLELLWVDKNYKSFKKFLFTMNKYKTVPIISADDGCYYNKNYAEDLYKCWLKKPNCIISKLKWSIDGVVGGSGSQGILYPPNCFNDIGITILQNEYNLLNKNPNDDRFIGCLAKAMKIKWLSIEDITGKHQVRDNITNFKNDKVGMTNNLMYQPGTNWKFPKIIKKYLR